MSKKITYTIISIIFWIFLWYVISCKINSEIFLPSPKSTLKALIHLSGEVNFWRIILSTFGRIVQGFIYAVVFGVICALSAYFIRIIDIILSPFMKMVKAVPVVSFIILALLWVDSQSLPILISFGMVLPVIYINVLQGFRSVNKNMLEMSRVFSMSRVMRLRFIYLPCIQPCFISACKLGLGFCFKAGIAAEVIGLPIRSIGSELYKSKLYLMTDELFAWTVVIVLLSAFFEGVCIYILNRMGKLAGKINFVGKVKNPVCKNKCEINSESKSLLVSHIYKSFKDNKVLENVNLEMDNGIAVCVSGESGIGKTTLLKIIAGIIRPDKGSIRLISKEDRLKNRIDMPIFQSRICAEATNSVIASENLRFSLRASLKSFGMEISVKDNTCTNKYKVSMVFQENRLIEESDIYTNIYSVMGNNYSKEETDRHLNMVGLEGMGNVKVSELSGGMKRRVAIIRAMIKESDIILLDEPFKGLDDRLKLMVMDYVKKNVNGRIVLIVSHDMKECESMECRLFKMSED